MDNTEILVAAMSDPEFKVRLAQLREEQAAIKEAQEALQADHEKNAALVAAAREHRRIAEEALALVAEEKKQLETDTQALAAANQAMNEEKTRWETIVRQPVEAQHIEKDAELTERETRVKAREDAVEKRETDVKSGAADLIEGQRRHAAAAEHARKFIDAL